MVSRDRTREAFERGASAWPTIHLPEDEFALRAANHVDAAEESDRLHAEDLYLAIACVTGNRRALAVLNEDFMPNVVAAVRKMRGSDDQADEISQILRERLLVGGQDRPPRLANYSGRGPLSRWLFVAATREYLSHLRKTDRLQGIDDEVLGDVAALTGTDPELAHMKERYRSEFTRAFQRALEQLCPEEKNLLRHRFVDGLSVTALANLRGVHRTTVHRQLAAACAKLADEVERALRVDQGIQPEDVPSIRGLIRSRLQISIERLLTPAKKDDD